jgi:putative ABC transport system permease protein
MYPNLTPWLVGLLALAGLALLAIGLREPVAGHLALRQIARRPTEATLVVLGSVLGTAIIVSSLVVGDTLNHSVRKAAYDTLGPVDEMVVSSNTGQGEIVANRIASLTGDPDVDGVLHAKAEQAAVARSGGGEVRAEPKALAWEIDLGAAAGFGAAGSDPGLSGPTPTAGQVVLNEPLADAVGARAGDRVNLYLYGQQISLSVLRVVPERGVAGVGFGGSSSPNAFLVPGTLDRLGVSAGAEPRSVTFVSNRGGVEDGAELTDTVVTKINTRVGAGAGAPSVTTAKRDVLEAAQQTGNALGSVFLFIGSFSIIAGILLLITIFVMLAEERKPQLGMLRAVGMKRSRLVGAFGVEGAVYAAIAALLGVILGIAIGGAVAFVAARIFGSWSVEGDGLEVSYAVTPISLLNGFAMGLLISAVTVLLTSVRMSRFNIIAAIRDLPGQTGRRPRRWFVATATILAALTAAASVPTVAASDPIGTFLLPTFAILCAIPLGLRLLPRRLVISLASALVLVWTLLVNAVRPGVYDSASTAVYVIVGVLLTFSAVGLINENQEVLLAPLRPLLRRPSRTGLSVRLGLAYPLARRFRTGSTLIMYSIVVFTLVLITEINGIISANVDEEVADATSGYSLRVDFNPTAEISDPRPALRDGTLANEVTAVATLRSAPGLAEDPGRRTDRPLAVSGVGVPPDAGIAVPFAQRLPEFSTDAAAWQALHRDARYVVVDQNFGATGGPPGNFLTPGQTFQVKDPRTGRATEKTIAGILTSGVAFYSATGDPGTASPLIMSDEAVRETFPTSALASAALLRSAPGVAPDELASRLQGSYLHSGLVATPIESTVRRLYAGNASFFQLMQGFLSLGLLVGVTALGVLMIRAVRERRRTIGVLRALGFQASTVRRAFLTESSFIALEGTVIGAVLAVVTAWLMYEQSAAFATIRGGFPIAWLPITIVVLGTFVASLLATVGPARRAAAIRPALAVRVAD